MLSPFFRNPLRLDVLAARPGTVPRWLRAASVAGLLGTSLLLMPEPQARATECSLVVNGALLDIACSRDPATGLQVSLEALSLIARGAGDIAISARPDRGHVVITSGQSKPTVASLAGFKHA